MWVIGIREIRYIKVPKHPDSCGPVVYMTRRTCEQLPREVCERLLNFRVTLPECRGAGPCGTATRALQASGVLTWSIANLIEPLRVFYATYREPLHFGAKQGPRGRKVA